MTLNRVTEGVNFNTGISMAEYNESPRHLPRKVDCRT